MNSQSYKKHSLAYRMIFPTVLTMLIVHIIPIAMGIYISFRNLDKYTLCNISKTVFVGLRNYINLLGSLNSDFLSSLSTTFRFMILTVVISYILGLACALIGNEKFRGQTIFRGVMLIPLVIPSVVSLTCLRFMLQQNGIINQILLDLHLIKEPIIWLVGRNTFFVILIGNVWIKWPLFFSVFLSGMQAIPEELFEAASIDGANYFQKLKHITLPSLKNVTFITTMLIAVWSFNDFNVPYIMLGCGYTAVPDAANLISLNIYRSAFFALNFSSAAAQSVLMSLISFTLILVYVKLITKPGGETNA
jgi:multiple sugar transport system permease protein